MERLQHEESENTEGTDSETNEDLEVEDFTKLMGISTRKVHKLTDLLVNAKLGLALTDDKVWAEGLLIFYEIFHFLEEALNRTRRRIEVFERMSKVISGIERTAAFEQDLRSYYGNEFLVTNYSIRPSVGNYLRHLTSLEEREPLRLLSYIYHLYLGLLSGGQILKRKRELQRKLVTMGGLIGNTIPENQYHRDAVTQFNDGRSIQDIKKEIKFTMNDIASDLSKDERDSLLQEGIIVFRYNLEIIQTIEGTGRSAILALLKHPFFICTIIVIILLLCYFVF